MPRSLIDRNGHGKFSTKVVPKSSVVENLPLVFCNCSFSKPNEGLNQSISCRPVNLFERNLLLLDKTQRNCVILAYIHGYTYIHTCMHACIHIYMHACMYVCIYACMYVCMYTHVCIPTYVRKYVCACACVRVRVCVCVCVCRSI